MRIIRININNMHDYITPKQRLQRKEYITSWKDITMFYLAMISILTVWVIIK